MATILPIVNHCNQNCLFCAAKGRDDNLALRHIYQCIDREEDSLVISGGEPTLSRDLFKIIKYAQKRDLNIELQTNGITLSYYDLAKKLMEAKIDLFNINFPSHLERLTDKITQTEGFFKRRSEGVKNLQRLKTKIRLTHIINSLNFRYLEEFVDYIKNNFDAIDYIQFSFIKIQGNTKKNLWIVPLYREVQPYLLNALTKCQKYNIDFLVDHIPTCYLPHFEDHHADFRKIKMGIKAEFSGKEKIQLRECKKCILANLCCGVRRDHLRLFRKENIILRPQYK